MARNKYPASLLVHLYCRQVAIWNEKFLVVFTQNLATGSGNSLASELCNNTLVTCDINIAVQSEIVSRLDWMLTFSFRGPWRNVSLVQVRTRAFASVVFFKSDLLFSSNTLAWVILPTLCVFMAAIRQVWKNKCGTASLSTFLLEWAGRRGDGGTLSYWR